MTEVRQRKRRLSVAAAVAALAVLALAFYFIHPPGPGHVYRYRLDQYGTQGDTVILLRKGDCLAISRSELDVGRPEAAAGSESRLSTIAGTRRVRSGRDETGAYLIDSKTGLIARPGDAIDGEVIHDQTPGGFQDTLKMGWPWNDRCGRSLAIILSIERVHR